MRSLTPIHPLQVVALAMFAVAATWAPQAAAQDDPQVVILNAAQNAKMASGRAAYREGRFEEAAAFYNEALSLGPFNLGFLNKGRSLQRAGQCDEAMAAFHEIRGAPVLAEPAPDTIRGAMSRYVEELHRNCAGILAMECDPADAVLNLSSIDEGLLDTQQPTDLPSLSCDRSTSLPPGTYVIEAMAHNQTKTYTVDIQGVETTHIEIVIAANPETQIIVKEVSSGPDPLQVGGWSTVTIGGLALAMGVTFSVLTAQNNEDMRELSEQNIVRQSQIDDLQSKGDLYQTLQFVGYGVGLASLTTGAILLYLYEPQEEDTTNPGPTGMGQTRLDPLLAPNTAGVVWTVTY
ncbi:MAG: tetratricopeptide repeat protein [Myxococcota bacterium]